MSLPPDLTEVHPPDGCDEIPDDPRLVSIAEEYLARLQAGEHPTPDEYIRRYPELAALLNACLAGLEAVHGVVRQGLAFPAEWSTENEEHQPKILGDFRIGREVGAGGMGVVYEAEQISLRRRVALKVLSFAATLQQRQLQRFLNEARAAANLHHPHIVPVFAVGSERGVYYYAMQFVDGISLAELITQLRKTGDLRASLGCPNPALRRNARTGRPTKPRRSCNVHGRKQCTSCRVKSRLSPRATPTGFSASWPNGFVRLRRPWLTPTSWGSSIATSNRPI